MFLFFRGGGGLGGGVWEGGAGLAALSDVIAHAPSSKPGNVAGCVGQGRQPHTKSVCFISCRQCPR